MDPTEITIIRNADELKEHTRKSLLARYCSDWSGMDRDRSMVDTVNIARNGITPINTELVHKVIKGVASEYNTEIVFNYCLFTYERNRIFKAIPDGFYQDKTTKERVGIIVDVCRKLPNVLSNSQYYRAVSTCEICKFDYCLHLSYSPTDNKLEIKRIFRDTELWERRLLQNGIEFYEKHLKD